ncbi:MAG TPA: lmo0937 family membrane protein [Pyrinomonadaceae bacterium]|nr:lmo0937 family membrane protein [Pyrinomonadaceae bacterium]
METTAIILLVLWLLGMVTGQTFGGVLHAIIVVALVMFLVRFLTGPPGRVIATVLVC